MKILISAAETSSDIHGAELLAALKRIDPSLEAFGIGGPGLKREGLRAVVDARELLAMGFAEALPRLPKIMRGFKTLVRVAEQERPDVAVVLDYPEFHFRLARRFNQIGIPVVYYIPPKVWAWRQGRVKILRRRFAKVLSILPFETDFYRSKGMPVQYVGNSLTEELPLQMSKQEARRLLGLELGPAIGRSLSLAQDSTVITVMMGSRPSEVRHHIDLAMDAVRKTLEGREGSFDVLLPFPETWEKASARRVLETWTKRNEVSWRVHLSIGDSAICLKACDAAVVKSGTSTLEAALLGARQVVYFKPTWFTCFIFHKIIRYRGAIGLVNLAAGLKPGAPGFVPELLCKTANASDLSKELDLLLDDSDIQSERDETNRRVMDRMRPPAELGGTPAEAAARAVLSTRSDIPVESRKIHRFFRKWISVVWSMVNWLVRRLYRAGILKVTRLDSRVVSVGNLQAGGSGKTPLVLGLARAAIEAGQSVCILTRGYGGSGAAVLPPGRGVAEPGHVGDEVSLLRSHLPEAWFGVGKDRVRSYRQVCEQMAGKPSLVLLDDGFQHFKIARDLDLIAVTSWDRGDGIYRDFDREFPQNGVAVWTKGARRPALLDRVSIEHQLEIEFELPKGMLENKWVWIVSGLGMNDAFEASVRRAGSSVVGRSFFPDHHIPSQKDAEQVEHAIQKVASGRSVVKVMSEKDFVKWKSVMDLKVCLVVEPTLKFEPGKGLESFL